MKEAFFHGGDIGSEYFDGHTFWTRNPTRAAEYGSPLYAIEVDLAAEEVADEDAYLPDGGYAACETNDENWEMQAKAIRDAVAGGATVVLCDDGIVFVNVTRHSPRTVSLDEAYEMCED